ncbi:MAG: hypothetical protein KIS94_09800 [Chitinophagales bacterium]|nr:hypothetical protein [Chitinophagales bacterium]
MKFGFTFLLFITMLAAHAQVGKGRYLIGGSVDISHLTQGTETRNFDMSISPRFGVFVVKGFAVGGRYSFGVASRRVFKQKENRYLPATTFTTAIGPELSYFIGKKPLKGLVSVYGAYTVYTRLFDGDVQNRNGFAGSGFLGMAYFFNPYVMLKSGMYVNIAGYEGEFPSTRIGFSVGVAAVLDKKKKE